LNDRIVSKFISVDLMSIKETMQKSILIYILNVLLLIKKDFKSDKIDNFILNALSSEILDKKSRKQIESLYSK